MSIVYNKDKRSGITYAYESTSYWDKEKKMPRCRRTLIGRVDPRRNPPDGWTLPQEQPVQQTGAHRNGKDHGTTPRHESQ